MTERRTDDGMRDEDFVRRVAGAYEPPVLTPARRAAIDERVRARIDRRKRLRLVTPAATIAATAAAVLLLLRGPVDEPAPRLASPDAAGVRPAADVAGAAVTAAEREWEYALLFDTPVETTGDADRSAELPDDYAAIGDVFLASAAGLGEG